ncbi:murein biosynthesis integral membrane protein MurJ [Actinomadura xylanilytica]|uniref:murein biosynthesis integral membrane protein MurJ n=1 Tax=Actinomadura xylanilytica TaxID=887459 RepID=UPI00255AC76B|nr:murein biosynthesis integral membrane protein MurJ [Actinomadura xylanilytica]MDL4775789.1 murein biosynthesis integral membrane protein MurJ [Actinomadura xylanilytica]
MTHDSQPAAEPDPVPYVPADAESEALDQGEAPPAGSGGGLFRSSAIMAAGTFASRITGVVRTMVLVAALGTQALGDTFNTANTIPNIIYETLLGGVLTAAHVPLLVRARQRSAKYGEEFEQRLFTLLLGTLALFTAAAMALAPLLIRMYTGGFPPAQRDLATVFLLFFLPQIFFYGFSAVAGASLNAQGRFAAPMWCPVLNNVVVCAVGLTFIFVAGGPVDPDTITGGEVTLIAVGTTVGVVLQALGLIPSLYRMGFRWRPRVDFRPGELRSMGTMAGWTLVFVAAQQLGLFVYTNIANSAGARGVEEGIRYGVGLTPWVNAYQFFQLPFAIAAVSVITALFPRMSRSAAEGRLDRVADDLSSGLRLSLIIIIPSALLLFGLSAEICVVFFAHGATGIADALVIADVLRVFAVALIPYAALQLLQRGFYAITDTRTPALVGIFTTVVSIALALAGYRLLPTDRIVMGIAFAQGVAWTLGCAVMAVLLHRRLGTLHGRAIAAPIVKAVLAGLPALVLTLVIHAFIVRRFGQGLVPALTGLATGGLLGGALFLLLARLLRIDEITALGRTVAARLPGRRP